MNSRAILKKEFFLYASFLFLWFVFLVNPVYAGSLIWTWDSGTTENWYCIDNARCQINPGVSGYENEGLNIIGTNSFYLRNETDISIDVSSVVATGSVSVDMQHVVNTQHAEYIDLWIYGSENWARYIYYPYDGYVGDVTNLGHGWYRYNLVNIYGLGIYEMDPPDTPYILFGYHDRNATLNTAIDNLSISDCIDCIEEVDIDIQPGSMPNSINPKSKGQLPVAILTSDAFDATTVDPLSVEFGPNGAAESHGRGHMEDVDGDGDLDLVLHFRTREANIRCGDTTATLTGETFAGQAIQGTDALHTVRCR